MFEDCVDSVNDRALTSMGKLMIFNITDQQVLITNMFLISI